MRIMREPYNRIARSALVVQTPRDMNAGLPTNYSRIQLVNTFHALFATPFAGGVNAFCWPRALPGDFGEVVARLGSVEGVMALDEARLLALDTSAEGRIAINVMLEDLRLLRGRGLLPELNCIRAYPRDEASDPVRTDVYSFHADAAPVAAETWLCTYHGPPSEGLRNDEALRRVDHAETRAELRCRFTGATEREFEDHLSENCYDLHYAALDNAQPFSFGIGNLWRIAVEHPDSPVPPCIHRAPETRAGDAPRLLLIS